MIQFAGYKYYNFEYEDFRTFELIKYQTYENIL